MYFFYLQIAIPALVFVSRISCVDISPEWPEKKAVLTGSADGTVKQWNLERTQKTLNMKATHNHEIHSNEKEVYIYFYFDSRIDCYMKKTGRGLIVTAT